MTTRIKQAHTCPTCKHEYNTFHNPDHDGFRTSHSCPSCNTRIVLGTNGKPEPPQPSQPKTTTQADPIAGWMPGSVVPTIHTTYTYPIPEASITDLTTGYTLTIPSTDLSGCCSDCGDQIVPIWPITLVGVVLFLCRDCWICSRLDLLCDTASDLPIESLQDVEADICWDIQHNQGRNLKDLMRESRQAAMTAGCTIPTPTPQPVKPSVVLPVRGNLRARWSGIPAKNRADCYTAAYADTMRLEGAIRNYIWSPTDPITLEAQRMFRASASDLKIRKPATLYRQFMRLARYDAGLDHDKPVLRADHEIRQAGTTRTSYPSLNTEAGRTAQDARYRTLHNRQA